MVPIPKPKDLHCSKVCMWFCVILSHVPIHVSSPTFRTQNHPVITETTGAKHLSLVLLTLPPETTNLFFFIIMSFQECYINGIILYVIFWDWLFPLILVIHLPCCIHISIVHSFLLVNTTPWYKHKMSLFSNNLRLNWQMKGGEKESERKPWV